jgi:hypothetical protein
MVLGADSIDDTGVLRGGRTGRLLGGWIPARRRSGHFWALLLWMWVKFVWGL